MKKTLNVLVPAFMLAACLVACTTRKNSPLAFAPYHHNVSNDTNPAMPTVLNSPATCILPYRFTIDTGCNAAYAVHDVPVHAKVTKTKVPLQTPPLLVIDGPACSISPVGANEKQMDWLQVGFALLSAGPFAAIGSLLFRKYLLRRRPKMDPVLLVIIIFAALVFLISLASLILLVYYLKDLH